MKSFLDEMTNHITDVREILNNPLAVFMDIYAPYLEGFSEAECEEIKNSITSEMFTASTTASNATVKKAAEDYRKNQIKSQLYKLWNDKTRGSKNPRMWSEKYRTPILCCVGAALYTEAKITVSWLVLVTSPLYSTETVYPVTLRPLAVRSCSSQWRKAAMKSMLKSARVIFSGLRRHSVSAKRRTSLNVSR